jgi:hypothetical protein
MIWYLVSIIFVILFEKRNYTNNPKVLVIISIILSSLVLLLVAKNYSYPELLASATTDASSNVAVNSLQGIGSNGFNQFIDRFIHIWQVTSVKLTTVVLFLSLISLAFIRHIKSVAILLSFPLLYYVVLALTNAQMTGIDHHRFLLASFYFLIILCWFTLVKIYNSIQQGK